MQVTIEGVITSKEVRTKEDKTFTELLLAQKGEKMQTPIRLQGDQADQYELFEIMSFTGRLLTWKTRDGIGMMVSVG